MLQVVHFGGGSLGLGLVVATLAEAGARVTVVDADGALVEALCARGGYELEIHDAGAVHTGFVPIETALPAAAGSGALHDALASADLVTTSVRVPNLARVADVLDASLDASLDAVAPGGGWPSVVACENLAGSSQVLAAAVAGVRSWPAERVASTFLDAEVDRICQTAWPRRLAVATEPYREWAVQDPHGALARVPGVTRVDDLAPFFDRKRAFVNAVADAFAFLGAERGLTYLHEAAADAALDDVIGALQADLVAQVGRWPGFSAAGLQAYAFAAVERLANPGIRRRLDTVARDLERKLGPGERFAEPGLSLVRGGGQPVGIARVVAALIDTTPALWSRDWVSAWGGDEAASDLWELVARERRAP